MEALEGFFEFDDGGDDVAGLMSELTAVNPAFDLTPRTIVATPREDYFYSDHHPDPNVEVKKRPQQVEREVVEASLEDKTVDELHQMVRDLDLTHEIFLGRGSVLAHDRTVLRQVLAGCIVEEREEEKRALHGVAEEDDVGGSGQRTYRPTQNVVDAWLKLSADPWPEDAPPAPETDAEALDPDGPFGMVALGAEVKECTDDPDKGRGAFATRDIPARAFLGVYWGERLTFRQVIWGGAHSAIVCMSRRAASERVHHQILSSRSQEHPSYAQLMLAPCRVAERASPSCSRRAATATADGGGIGGAAGATVPYRCAHVRGRRSHGGV